MQHHIHMNFVPLENKLPNLHRHMIVPLIHHVKSVGACLFLDGNKSGILCIAIGYWAWDFCNEILQWAVNVCDQFP